MFDQQCLRDDGSRPTRSQQSGQGRQKMHEEHQKVTHGPRSYRYRLGLQVYEMRAICRDNRISPGTPSPAALTTLIQLVFREYSRRSYTMGLNPAQWAALRFFAHAEEQRCTASEFARFHRTKKSTAGQTIAALVRKAYLRRSPSVEDRRVTYLRVTEEGRAVL